MPEFDLSRIPSIPEYPEYVQMRTTEAQTGTPGVIAAAMTPPHKKPLLVWLPIANEFWRDTAGDVQALVDAIIKESFVKALSEYEEKNKNVRSD